MEGSPSLQEIVSWTLTRCCIFLNGIKSHFLGTNSIYECLIYVLAAVFYHKKEQAGPHNTLSIGLCSLRETNTLFFQETPLHIKVVLMELPRPRCSWL